MSRRNVRNAGATAAVLSALSLAVPARGEERVTRDQVLETAHLYYAVEFRVDARNLYTAEQIPGGRPAYDAAGWVRRVPYAWYGHDEFHEFLKKLADGRGAGDIDTSSGVPYSQGKVAGVECSGYVGECWGIPGRLFTSDIARDTVSRPVEWTALAPGDAVNYPRRHVRLVEQYPYRGDAGKILVYESTSGVPSGQAKGVVRRVLPDDFRADFKTGYTPRRFVGISSKPSLLSAVATGPDRVELRWLGDVGTDGAHPQSGFRVYRSADGERWDLVPGRDEKALRLADQSVVVTGLAPGQTQYFRVTAVKSGVESEPSGVHAARPGVPGRPRVLIVDGFDRWFVKPENPNRANHDFVRAYAGPLGAMGIAFDTADNLVVTRGGDPRDRFDLAGYRAVIYLLGDEGAPGPSRNYALNPLEQEALAAYLKGGGRLLISGSQLSEDLTDDLADLDVLRMNDATFYRRFLKVARSEGNAKTRSVAAGAGLFAGVGAFELDDGRVRYDVAAPDVLHPDGGASACLTYAGGAPAGLQYAGPFDGGAAHGRLVYLGFPIEAVVQAPAREALLGAVMRFFELASPP